MPDEHGFIVDLIVIIAAATGGGVLASALRLPVILGYLVAGLIVSNYIPGLDIDIDEIQNIADLGVALLLFTLGVQFSLAKLADVRRVAVVGGLAQIILTILLGLAIGSGLGLDIEAAVLLGGAMALSSTAVVLKVLDSRGELDTLHGRVAIGVLLVQDLAVVPLVIILPGIAGDGGASLPVDLGIALGKAAAFLGAAYVLGTRVVPRVLYGVAATGSRELFLLAVLSLALGFAGGSFLLGLSLAFGAFLAGLVVSESEYAYQTLADVLPLREVFATIFFVAMGMLIEPEVLMDDPGRVAAITLAIIFGKIVLASAPAALLGLPVRASLLMGFSLAQAGEFSFVVASVGIEEEIIDADLNSAILMSVLLSIVVTPLLTEAAPRVVAAASAWGPTARLVPAPAVAEIKDPGSVLQKHVVVCGYGRVGTELVRELVRRDFRCVVVEENPFRLNELRRLGVPFVYGDAANSAVLEACGLEHARLLAVTVPDPAAARLILAHARRINPNIDCIVRGRAAEDHDTLIEAGAGEVVHPEFEAGLEFVRHTLHRFGIDRTQIQALLARRRRDFHQHE